MKKLLIPIITCICLTSFANFSPNVTFGGQDSNVYGFILDAHLLNYFTPRFAGKFQLSGGEEEFNVGMNLGYQITEHNRVRVVLSHLAQRPEFNYRSFPTNNWAGQPSIGGTYEYQFGNSYITGIELSGYFATARSTNLRTIPFTLNNQPATNFRRVAGSRSHGFGAGIHVSLWPKSQLLVNARYDQLAFLTQYEIAGNTKGFGVSGHLVQQLPEHVAIAISGAARKIFDAYQICLDWTYPLQQHTALTIGVVGGQTFSDYLPATRDDRLGLYVSYSFNSDNTDRMPATTESLLGWTSQSNAALPGVFVQRDQRVTMN